MVPEPALLELHGYLLETEILRPHPDLLQQNLWEWGLAISVQTSPPGDSHAQYTCHWQKRTMRKKLVSRERGT